MASKKSQQNDNLQNIETALTRTEQFIEDNQTKIIYVIGAIVLVVVGYLGITRLYLQPREKEAQTQMFMAEQYFQKDSFKLVKRTKAKSSPLAFILFLIQNIHRQKSCMKCFKKVISENEAKKENFINSRCSRYWFGCLYDAKKQEEKR